MHGWSDSLQTVTVGILYKVRAYTDSNTEVLHSHRAQKLNIVGILVHCSTTNHLYIVTQITYWNS